MHVLSYTHLALFLLRASAAKVEEREGRLRGINIMTQIVCVPKHMVEAFL